MDCLNEMTKKMNERNNGACRLCLVEIYQKFDFISNTEKDMVQIILPDVNLEISENIVLCKTCSNLVEEAFIFKSTCLEIEDNIHNYASDEVQADLEKLIGLKDIDGGQRQKICRTCLDVIDNELVHELGCEKDNLLVNMLQKCLPEIDLHLTKQPVLCENCKSLLKKSYNFVCQCMENEQKISEYQRNNQGKTLDLIEAVQVITSKNEYKIPEINISNVLTSPNNSTKMGTSEQEKTERVVESVVVSIPHNQPKVDDIPGINIPNVLESPRDILKNESIEQEVTEKVVSSVQIVNANISPLMSPPQSQPDNEISQEDIIDCSQTIDLSELELASSVHAQSENDASKINNMDCHQKNDLIGIELPLYLPAEIYVSEAVNMDVDQQNESGELQLVSSKGNGEEIFVISDDDDVSDNSANENRQLMYNIRKRTKKKVSDEYAFREDLDDPAEDPDFNPEVDYSSDDISDVEKQKIEHKNKFPRKNIETDFMNSEDIYVLDDCDTTEMLQHEASISGVPQDDAQSRLIPICSDMSEYESLQPQESCSTETKRRRIENATQFIIEFYRCWKCGHESKYSAQIVEHLKFCSISIYSDKVRKFKKICECTECTFRSLDISTMIKHWKSVHKVEKLLKACKKYACSVCCQLIEKPEDSPCHKAKDLQLVYKCPNCTWKTPNASRIYTHFMAHKQISRYSCKICLELFNKTDDRNSHVHNNYKPHSPVKLYRCVYCSFVHKVHENVETHISKAHTELNVSKPRVCLKNEYFECPECKQCVAKRNHTKKIHLSCELCPFKTVREDSLRCHKKNHEKTSPYLVPCNICYAILKVPRYKYHVNNHNVKARNICT
ncbi:unnamed protein product [Phaedon cochleariae]|uniref:ZAD domain-containing protein n=1 Tax=Phaedon cochleariae TaxID=80249 RepID=A0A9N9X5C9_PHACE|nr:unnamed protein product [Phaedon cochleariae]